MYPSQFDGTMPLGKSESDSNCWSSPSGSGFMMRGKTYLKDSAKVTGGDPLLKLIAVDLFKVDECITKVALHSKCLVQIGVDIGSSSVARGVIGLVLGYVTSLVIDLAILIEAKEEAELPEYILGTVRLNRVKVDSAVPLEG